MNTYSADTMLSTCEDPISRSFLGLLLFTSIAFQEILKKWQKKCIVQYIVYETLTHLQED